LKESKAQQIADLGGMRVGIGPSGGTTSAYAPEILRVLRLNASFETGDWLTLLSQLKSQTLDALVAAGGAPFPLFTEREMRDRIRFLPMSPSQILDVRLAIPELSRSVVAAGTYPTLLRNLQTIGVFNFAVAQKELPDNLVYAIVDAVFDSQEELMAVHGAAAETIPGNFVQNTVLPFHSGAAKWYHHKSVAGIIGGD
jgi:TRAP transporter TAXI family solute receptor